MDKNVDRSEVVSLIERVRAKEDGAFEQLLSKYEPLIEASVARVCRDGLGLPHIEDLRQEATLVFYNAILNYDIESDGVEFGLYAKICIKNALITQSKVLRRRSAEQSSDIDIECEDEASAELSSRLIEEESLERIDRTIKETLSALEYRVWRLYVSGKTARSIGELLGKSEKSVSNAIFRIRKKLRDQLG